MRLPFELDPEIIHHIIYSQAGSVAKAIIELIMNSADAGASLVTLTISKEGFECKDNGSGFATRYDVKRYFGRFGTPHMAGDAKYGRFRLGRGQIMAHASTVWRTRRWQMIVDTKSMGYHYELDEMDDVFEGCKISGLWYEPLMLAELMSSVQEIKDLVRYTSIDVDLNGKRITRNPNAENWHFEDEHAFYRVKEEGAVAIYNQGVLVRNDASHVWGIGGVIVTKQPIDLNISRTEILRKTCPVWKVIAKQFSGLADKYLDKQNPLRKTEARREKAARDMLEGCDHIVDLYRNEEVITILPGKRHITLSEFYRLAASGIEKDLIFSVVESGNDIPKAEAIAASKLAVIVHPDTLSRFGVYSSLDFISALNEINQLICQKPFKAYNGGYYYESLGKTVLIDFDVLKNKFTERTEVLHEKAVLGKEESRIWSPLRWCLEQYSVLCTGGHIHYNNRARGSRRFKVLIGSSNIAEAWTDGESYIAINVEIVKKLVKEPLLIAGYIFTLIEHECAHEGDSLECGHDKEFFERFHEISVSQAMNRQRYLHLWLQRYTYSLEYNNRKQRGKALKEALLLERADKGRMTKGLSLLTLPREDLADFTPVSNDDSIITLANQKLYNKGKCPQPPSLSELLAASRLVIEEKEKEYKMQKEERRLFHEKMLKDAKIARDFYSPKLDIPPEDICDQAACLMFSYYPECSPEILELIKEEILPNDKPYEGEHLYLNEMEEDYMRQYIDDHESCETNCDPHIRVNETHHHLVREGETSWSLERNAEAAGFSGMDMIEDYLYWRSQNE
ncbi:ATP-binding protein [Pseudomonas luteola]